MCNESLFFLIYRRMCKMSCVFRRNAWQCRYTKSWDRRQDFYEAFKENKKNWIRKESVGLAIVAIVGGLIYDGIRQYIYKIYDVGLDEVNVRCEVNDDRRILVFEPKDDEWGGEVVRNWIRNRKTLEFLATWEEIYNPNFKVFESEHFKKQVGLLTFTPSVSEWINKYIAECSSGSCPVCSWE